MKTIVLFFCLSLFSCASLNTSRNVASVKTSPFTIISKNYKISGQMDEIAGSRTIAIFFHGSGVQDRWGTMPSDATLTKKPESFFKPIAEELNKHGVSTCVFDKRAFAEKGKPEFETVLKTFSFENIKSDAAAVVGFVNGLSRYDKIIFIGHSEGTVTASEIAFDLEDNKKIDKIVLIGVLAENLKTSLYRQYTNVMADNTFVSADKNHDGKIYPEEVPDSLKAGLPIDKIDKDKKGYITYSDLMSVLKIQVDGLFKAIQEAPADIIISNKPVQWYRDFFGRKTLIERANEYSRPVLIAHGERDTNVPFSTNAAPLNAKFLEFKKEVTLKSYPNYGHGLSPESSGLSTFGPVQADAISDIISWIAFDNK